VDISEMVKKLTNQDGYKLVLDWFIAKNGGRRHGSKKIMAAALGISRQSADNYETSGIPPKYIRQIRKITGLTAAQIRPEEFQ
jgi:hypothetical protein